MPLSRRAVLAALASPAIATVLPRDTQVHAAASRLVAYPDRLDYSPFLDAIEAISDDRHAELDSLLVEATTTEIQDLLTQVKLTSRELVLSSLRRIGIYDDWLHAVLSLNPELLTIADRLDAERARGDIRGPLHGIPVLLKDNIGTGDKMTTTAGAAALATAHCDRDAYLVRRLRGAGLILLGKANLSEWAGWMANEAPDGYSVVGGQTANPYSDWLSPLGSSTGSAVAVAASYTPLAIGTETLGSIIAPAHANSVVGMHPSVGLISRDRLIPLFDQLDTPGPLSRTVADSAALLTVLANKRDPNDPQSPNAKSLIGRDFQQALRPDGLQGLRVGLLPSYSVATEEVDQALQPLFDAGANGEPFELTGFDYVWVDELTTSGFRIGLENYLAVTRNPDIHSVADVIAFNDTDPDQFAPFGEDLLWASADSSLGSDEIVERMTQLRADMRDYLTSLMDAQQLDLIVSVNGELAGEYGIAGFPAITVPAGYQQESGAPFGLTFVGPYLADETVIAAAYAYEQSSRLRQAPPIEASRT